MRILSVSVLPDSSFRLGMVPCSILIVPQRGDKKQRRLALLWKMIDMTTSVV
jgi:hypothetical protein